MYVRVCMPYEYSALRSQKSIETLGAGITSSREYHMGAQNQKSAPLEEQPSLQPEEITSKLSS